MGGISEAPYKGMIKVLNTMTKALNNITKTLNQISSDLCLIRCATNLQTQYLEVIGRKINKKGFKRYFGRQK